jgi:hypothetical protein
MWNYYKKTFLAVQLLAGMFGWMVYRSSGQRAVPVLVCVLSMQISAVFGAMWANRLGRKMRSATVGPSNSN